MTDNTRKTLHACMAGLCIFIIAIGINRFSYAAIIPYLVNDKWVSLPQAGYVGSANYLGYFIGALIGNKLIKHFSMRGVLVATLLLSLVGSGFSILNLGFIWLALWRCVVGIVAGILMVLSPTMILAGISDHKKSLVSGLMFAGIGIGIGASCFLTPLFAMKDGVYGIWIGMALLTLILGAIALPKCIRAEGGKRKHAPPSQSKVPFVLLSIILVTYMLYGIGLTPVLLFLSDYVHRSLGATTSLSAIVFTVLGIGAIAGSIVSAWLMKRLGGYFAVLIITLLGLLATILLAFSSNISEAFVGAFLSGFYLLAMVVVMSVYLGELVGMQKHSHYWALLTLCYAVVQIITSYCCSYALAQHMSYQMMFGIGAIFLACSFVSYACLKFVIEK